MSASLEIPKRAKNRAFGWLLLSVLSLVFAGLFALMVALARTPVIEVLLPLGRDYIYVALVGHVVLAVVIWFLAFEGFLWAYHSIDQKIGVLALLGPSSLILSYAGVALVVVSALMGLGEAELANYVPVLLTPVFFTGLILFSLGALVNIFGSLPSMSRRLWDNEPAGNALFGLFIAGIAVLIAFACFLLSWYMQYSTGKAFLDFERLFWGGGHVLQFANTIAMVSAWLILLGRSAEQEIGARSARALLIVYLLFIIPAPFIYFIHDTSTQAHKDGFTSLMRWGLGPSTVVFMALIIGRIAGSKGRVGAGWSRPGFSSLVLSMALFAIGGFIALLISGVNTIIPAHYHCVIGAVTMAFMGVFYEVLPSFSRRIRHPRLASVQPYLYFAGIVIFAVGLYIAGTHGVMRKTYAGEQNLNNFWKVVGMSVMGVGGLVAIAGGISFVYNALISLFSRPKL